MKWIITLLLLAIPWTDANLTVNSMAYDESAYQRLSEALEAAANSAAMEVVPQSISDGDITFDQTQADQTFRQVLAANLDLDPNTLQPRPHSMFQQAPVIELEQFVDYTNATFPYHYQNSQYGIDVTLNGPSIIYVVQIPMPRLYKSSPSFYTTWETVAAYPDKGPPISP